MANSKPIVKEMVVSRAEGVSVSCAAELAKAAEHFSAVLTVSYADRLADGKNIIQLLMLGACRGAVVQVLIEGQNAQAALQAIEGILQPEH